MVGVLALGVWSSAWSRAVHARVGSTADADRRQAARGLRHPRERSAHPRARTAWLEDESLNPEIAQTLTYVGNGGVRFFVTLAPETAAPNMGFILVTLESIDQVQPVMRRIREHARAELPVLDLIVKRMFMGSIETGLVEARISTIGFPGSETPSTTRAMRWRRSSGVATQGQHLQRLREPHPQGRRRGRPGARPAGAGDERRDRQLVAAVLEGGTARYCGKATNRSRSPRAPWPTSA